MNEEELKLRIRTALDILPDGNSFKVGDLNFKLESDNLFTITGWTTKNNLEHLSRTEAQIELQEIKELFNEMSLASSELANFVKNRELEFNLGFDYGMGGVGVCSERNGQLTWETELGEI